MKLAIGFVLGLIVAGAVCAYNTISRITSPSVLAKELAKEETTTLTCKPVVVYRDKVKDKLNLPESVKKDATKHVANSTQVEPSDHPTTVSAVYDDQTGHIDLFKRTDQLPWMTVATRYGIGAYYGVGTDTDGPVGLLRGDVDLLKIKALSLGFTGTIDTNSNRFIGVGGMIRF
jgi:hypothetical protein